MPVTRTLALRDDCPRLGEQLVQLRALWRDFRASSAERAPIESQLEAMTSQWHAVFARQLVLRLRWALATMPDLVTLRALSSGRVMRRTLFALLRAVAPPAQRLLRRAIVVRRGSGLDDEATMRRGRG